MDLGTTSTLFLHLQTGGGRCLQAMGLTIEAFRKEFRKKQSNTITKQKVWFGNLYFCLLRPALII